MRAKPYLGDRLRQVLDCWGDATFLGSSGRSGGAFGHFAVRSGPMTRFVDVAPLPAHERARSLLSERLGVSRVLTEPDACERFRRDGSEVVGPLPDAVVLAGDASDIDETLRVAREVSVAVTPRSGGARIKLAI